MARRLKGPTKEGREEERERGKEAGRELGVELEQSMLCGEQTTCPGTVCMADFSALYLIEGSCCCSWVPERDLRLLSAMQ